MTTIQEEIVISIFQDGEIQLPLVKLAESWDLEGLTDEMIQVFMQEVETSERCRYCGCHRGGSECCDTIPDGSGS